MNKRPPETLYGPVEFRYGRFVGHREFMRLFTPRGHELVLHSPYLQICLLVGGGSEHDEFAITSMLDRRTDLPMVMRYLRQWLQSEPARIAHILEDTNRCGSQSPDRDVTTSADRQSQAKQPETQEGSAFETGVVEILHPERGEVVVEVGLKDVRARRNRFRQVEQAFHELEAAHPEIIADPNDDLSIQDPELEQILREHNARQTGPRAEGNDPEDPGEEKG